MYRVIDSVVKVLVTAYNPNNTAYRVQSQADSGAIYSLLPDSDKCHLLQAIRN
jgi:hypothetical protein